MKIGSNYFFIFIFLLVFHSGCSLVEKTRRHLLGDPRPTPTPPQSLQTKAPADPTTPVAGEHLDNQGVVVSAVDERPQDSTAPELANPNTLWVFDSNLAPNSSGTQDLAKLQGALELYSNKQWDAAMGQLRTLVQSNNDQVQVRARFYAGKILQYKNKHQLALQVFEQIIQQNGYSSLALLSVREAVLSARMSQLKDKEVYYQTSLDEITKQAAIP